MATRAMQGTATTFRTLQRPQDAALRTDRAPEKSGAGFFNTLGHGVWAMSFQAGLTGASELSYRGSQALSQRDKALLDALKMGFSL